MKSDWLIALTVVTLSCAPLHAPPPALGWRAIALDDVKHLAPLEPWVGDARVVMLGEHHSDGTSLLAMTELVRQLHERHGFDVLLFESGLLDLAEVDVRLGSSTEPVGKVIDNRVAYPWAHSNEARGVFDYVRATKRSARPMTLGGFDVYEQGAELVERAVQPAQPTEAEANCLQATIHQPLLHTEPCFESVAASLLARLDVHSLAARVIENLRTTNAAEALRVGAPSQRTPEGVAYMNRVGPQMVTLRDEGMARTLRWLLEHRFKGQKVIVWGAQLHVARTSPAGITTMGQLVNSSLGTQSRVLAFTWYDGALGLIGEAPEPEQPAEPGSLEALLHGTGHGTWFVDLRGAEHLPEGNVSPQAADGVLYFEHVAPNTATSD